MTTARRINTGSYRFVRLGDAVSNVLTILDRKFVRVRLGTNRFNNLQTLIVLNPIFATELTPLDSLFRLNLLRKSSTRSP
jgi:hypothetical protein